MSRKSITLKGGKICFSTYKICSECGYKVNNSKAFKLHIRYSHPDKKYTHLGEIAPFFCLQCGLSFETDVENNKHFRDKHGGKGKLLC